MRKILLAGFLLVLLFNLHALAQSNATVFDPSLPTRFLTSSDSIPVIPPSDNNVYRWYATKKQNWDTGLSRSYIFNGMAFRLRYPKNYDPTNTAKKYPLILSFSGVGAKGTVYENDAQICLQHNTAIDNGSFDGFLLFPYTPTPAGFYNDVNYDKIAPLLGILTANNQIDPNKIISDGYSGGGIAVVEMLAKYPKLFAAATPMSVINGWRTPSVMAEIPMWVFQGALDNNPKPYDTGVSIQNLLNIGANVKYTVYPNLGHGTWIIAWGEKDYYPFVNKANKANPIVYFGRTEFCKEDTPNAKLGLTAGFDGYQWKKNDTLIDSATSNILQINSFGTYSARIKRGNDWSPWSPIPIVIKLKDPAVPPTITVTGNISNVLPAPDTNKVTLQVPSGYVQYEWRKENGTQVLGTTSKLTVSEPGNYVVKATEQYACSALFSKAFTVVDANGANKPDAAFNLSVYTLSKTELLLNWANKINPVNNETAFEIYRSTTSGGQYKYIGKVGADTLKYQDKNLTSNVQYFYVVRSVNKTGASAISSEASAKTEIDNVPPTIPGNLKITATTRTYIDLAWDKSTDDVSLRNYNIYVNDTLAYSAPATVNTFRVNNLTYKKVYTFRVVAKDIAGNSSLSSNQVSATAANNGFSYRYYETATNVTTLPDFNQLRPVKTGQIPNVSLTAVSPRADNFGVLYEGFINIPTSGNYTFQTNSDDGSKLYIGSYNPTAIALVDNDGAHTVTTKEGTINLSAGIYPFTVTFLEISGGAALNVYWRNTPTGVGSTAVAIPNSYFTDVVSAPVLPAAPSQLTATTKGYDQIQIAWTDNATNETGFEIYRSDVSTGNYVIAGKVASNILTFTDTKLTASKAYYYKVKAISLSGESVFSNTANATTNAAPAKPSVPAGFTLSNVTSSSLKLQWNVAGAASDIQYAIYQSINDNTSYAKIKQDTSTTGIFNITSLYPATKYTYKIKAINLGGESNFTQEISATTSSLQTYSVNFNSNFASDETVASPWNNTNSQLGANTVINLVDNNGATTPVKLTFLTAWPGFNNLGKTTGNNSGIYPDNVMKTFYYVDNDNAMQMKVSGLSSSKRYNFVFFDSWKDPWVTGITNYSIGSTKVQLDPSNNTSKTVEINNVSPDVNGEIVMSVQRIVGAGGYGFINALVIQAVDLTGAALTPTNLAATGSKGSITLNWQDNSTNESGFEVSRSSTETGTYTVLTTTAANITTYIDSGLTSGTKYWYKLRALASTGNSNYTASVSATASSLQTYSVNFNSNFTSDETVASPWNNTNSQLGANTVINLVDNNGATTPVKLTFLTTWPGFNNLGKTTGNNSGIYPDNVMKTFYYVDNDNAMQMKVSGLSSSKRYNFVFFDSWKDPWVTGITNYSIGSTKVQLDPSNNTSKTVEINNVSPDVNGEIVMSVQRIVGAGGYGFINALVIQAVDSDGTIVLPGNLSAKTVSKTAITLNWQDNSTNESGFEVSRSSTETGTYTVIATIAANAISYTDSGLPSNTKYWYKVRALSSTGNSNYMLPVAASTYTYSVMINFNSDQTAPKPWNNTNTIPKNGNTLPNLVNTDDVNTGIVMTLPDNFTAANNLGVVTGNNSGKYPDNVMKTFYYSEKNETARIKLSGLNTLYSYDVEFFNSWANPFANATTIFTINGTTVSLDPSNNTNKTALIYNVNPNQYGEITIDVFMPTESAYSLLNALVLNAHPIIGSRPVLIAAAKGSIAFSDFSRANSNAIDLKPYPNPFLNRISINTRNTKFASIEKLKIDLVDQNGRMIFSGDMQNSGVIDIDIQKYNLMPGVYFIRISGNKVQPSVYKMIKN